MALNPFFLQGSASEQRLVQDLINEQLKIYGVEVVYIPRKFVNKKTIIEEVQSSKFDDNFSIEAYVNTYEGYSGSGDILTKFGMSLRDELVITISKERFEDFIAPFMGGLDDGTGQGEIVLSTRPREGDLIYFPLGERIFEVKFVEHEQPFYQLGKNYVYELKCELFEYEDEVLDTSIDEIDTQIKDEGYITTLSLVGLGETASATAIIGSGYVNKIYLNNDGYSYISPPKISLTPSPTGNTGDNATAVAIGTYKGRSFKLQNIYLVNSGIGYTVAPTITFSGGGGTGAAATCSIETTQSGIVRVNISNGGDGYITTPTISFGSPTYGAAASASVGASGTITSLTITNPGIAYTAAPTITISGPPSRTGIISTLSLQTSGAGYIDGTYSLSPVYGGVSGTQALVGITTGAGGVVSTVSLIYGGLSYVPGNPYTIVGGNNNGRILVDTITTGIGSTATAIATIGAGGTVTSISITNPGFGYTVTPTVTIDNSDSIKDSSYIRAVGIASIGLVDGNNIVTTVLISNPGIGYTVVPTVTVGNPNILTGYGDYIFNEIVRGSRSQTRARVKSWDKNTNTLKISLVGIGATTKAFYPGENIIGLESGAIYSVQVFNQDNLYDKYSQNDEIEEEADLIVDFTESNPFGTY